MRKLLTIFSRRLKKIWARKKIREGSHPNRALKMRCKVGWWTSISLVHGTQRSSKKNNFIGWKNFWFPQLLNSRSFNNQRIEIGF
jgi:hypothetical protein